LVIFAEEKVFVHLNFAKQPKNSGYLDFGENEVVSCPDDHLFLL
jgi:hypothetical protein